MGNGQSLQASIKLASDSMQKTVNSVLNNSTNQVQYSAQNLQTLEIINEGQIRCKNGFTINQQINSSMNVQTSITSQTATQIQTALNSELNNKTSQTNAAIQGFLASLPGSGGQNLSTELNIRNVIKQIIQNNTTVNHLNAVLNSTLNIQKGKIYIGKNAVLESDGDCQINQNIQSVLVGKAIVNDIISNIQSSASLQRIVNDVSQSNSATQKGLDDLIGQFAALAWPLAMVAVAFLFTGGTIAYKGVGSLSDWRFLLIMALGLILYITISYFMQWPPFRPAKPPEFWGCAFDSSTGFSTGDCTLRYDPESGPFSDQKSCQDAAQAGKVCAQYWGCEKNASGMYTGSCKQYNNPADGPYRTKDECETKIRAGTDCSYSYECGQANQTCYQKDGLGMYRTLAECQANCAQSSQ
jgi:DNA-binding transcriptional MerR regulator